jgi:hypothetical protein
MAEMNRKMAQVDAPAGTVTTLQAIDAHRAASDAGD